MRPFQLLPGNLQKKIVRRACRSLKQSQRGSTSAVHDSRGTGKTMNEQNLAGKNQTPEADLRKRLPFFDDLLLFGRLGKTLAKPPQSVFGISAGAYEKL